METFAGLLSVPAVFVACLLVYSGIAKLSSQQAFVQSLILIPFLPHQLSKMVGVAVPISELVIGASLLWNSSWAKIAAIILLGIFSSVALLASSRNQRVPCNCFGTQSSEFLSKATVARNAALALAVAITLPVPAGSPQLVTTSYGLVAFFTFLCVLQTAKNSTHYRQLRDGILP